MFKTLLASTFLLFNVSSKVPVTRDSNYIYSLYGAYCFKDHITYEKDALPDEYTYLDYNTTEYYARMTYQLSYDDVYNYNTVIDNMDITYDDTNDYYVFHIYDGDFSLRQNITSDEYLYDMYGECWELVLFFPAQFNVTADGYRLFTTFFTSEGNNWVTNYSGWYTITNPQYTSDIKLNGFFNISNNLYNEIEFVNHNFRAWYRDEYSYDYSGDSYVDVIVDSKLKVSSLLYFDNVLIPNYLNYNFRQVGTFSYQYTPVEYTFGDMIFSVIDAPIYMLSQLFSFELFGLQFYVGFIGVVTLLLICIIVKKLV